MINITIIMEIAFIYCFVGTMTMIYGLNKSNTFFNIGLAVALTGLSAFLITTNIKIPKIKTEEFPVEIEVNYGDTKYYYTNNGERHLITTHDVETSDKGNYIVVNRYEKGNFYYEEITLYLQERNEDEKGEVVMIDNNSHLRITKCYLVEVIDEKQKEITSDLCFGTKEDALKLGEKLKKNLIISQDSKDK